MAELNEVEALLKAQDKEYGTYVAKNAIYYGGARAFNPGNAVPVSHVEGPDAWVDADLVAKAGTKAAAAIVPPTDTPA